MARDMLSLVAYSLPDEWRSLKDCTKNVQDGAYKIGIPIAAKSPHPIKKISCCHIPATFITYHDKILTRI
jgi:hypothetical protein